MVFCCFFFFQAEDGIRDVERSRGLGDVYKRQYQRRVHGNNKMSKLMLRSTTGEILEISVSLEISAGELVRYLVEKFRHSPKVRIVFNGRSLNESPQVTLKDIGVNEKSELLVLNPLSKTIFDEIRERSAKRSVPEKKELFGKMQNTDSSDMKVTPQLIAHVTEAKKPLKNRSIKNHSLVELREMLESENGSSSLLELLSMRMTSPPDPEKVQQLVEMGFPQANAERALSRYGNNVSRATEHLLSQGEGVEEEEPPRVDHFRNLIEQYMNLRGISEHLKESSASDNQSLIPSINLFHKTCLLYTSPSPRDLSTSRMPSSA
eukprot:TRINITY_DN28295_c0_g1_i1.p1 TRINITY_DN28295_c0_g1~~TRINITY_DN28295_c0_g1_i1.p1  ORF type:complete len:320 (+),score=69.39 TRINITY_DN28295_c0_g1_i1:120-1079(+)